MGVRVLLAASDYDDKVFVVELRWPIVGTEATPIDLAYPRGASDFKR